MWNIVNGFCFRNYVGREVVGAYAWLPRYEWVILTEMGKDEILAPLASIKITVLVTAAVVSGLCLFMAFMVSRRVSRPITAVAQAAKEIAEGRLDRRIEVRGEDEIGALAGSFNAMTRRLADLIASLRRKEESLQNACNQLVTAQQQLVQAEKMAAIGELAASVVHEMRNPLSSIKLNLQIIGRGLTREAPLAEHYQIAVEQVAQLEKMFADLLNYSRPLTIQPAYVEVGALLARCTQQLASELTGQAISVTTDLQEPVAHILGDADRIEQVIVNVLKNAMEAAGPGSRIEISVAGDALGKRPMVTIRIADNGPGIPPQHLKRIFQPFFTTKKKGTGLGLAIVRKIMDVHQGEISVESAVGQGTTVRLSFPGAEA